MWSSWTPEQIKEPGSLIAVQTSYELRAQVKRRTSSERGDLCLVIRYMWVHLHEIFVPLGHRSLRTQVRVWVINPTVFDLRCPQPMPSQGIQTFLHFLHQVLQVRDTSVHRWSLWFVAIFLVYAPYHGGPNLWFNSQHHWQKETKEELATEKKRPVKAPLPPTSLRKKLFPLPQCPHL